MGGYACITNMQYIQTIEEKCEKNADRPLRQGWWVNILFCLYGRYSNGAAGELLVHCTHCPCWTGIVLLLPSQGRLQLPLW